MTFETVYRSLLDLLSNYVNEDGEYIVEFIDSLDFIQIIIAIENEFNFEFDDDMLTLEGFKNLHILTDYIFQKVGA
ncbi:phosphopantetheine-containing protein [Priestia filamentosa]|uniref:phosphopantetheine-binding protein n=1 Tax=Priestia filamentosa TaxID=1402861 RepID=UPI001FB268C7|nr:phosphopantetheine-binding protein [Priestia filamentosa]UOE58269.1 phosphopantetheine-containing protein [Priestia filamentosa]